MQWVFIGAGNMASSLIGGLINSGAEPSGIAVVDPDQASCERASERFGIRSASSLGDMLKQFSTAPLGLVIAVKPHIVEAVCVEYASVFADFDSSTQQLMSPLIISVAAGVRASSMETWLPEGSAIVRCMPNTPSLLGLGATGLYANAATSDKHREQAQSLMDSAGVALWVDAEAKLDAVTAVSGSGPAYFFYLIEHMCAAGTALGLDAETAEKLAIETAFGAASMARTRELPPSRLRENVTSKGGTTAAALQVFDQEGTPAIIHKAMQAAHDRAVEFGDQLAPD
ncbi:pyrroline-5-carboxylate reductase [Granulosicoccus antarcticus]|uniref:Pyrroline-5-carboxylate reductase n=1 Tax=Granulosicoccus antarcticus IMCC3135 TaxID=1192854 RepID=A0A2Z2NIV1_9GAMM|nr:pyrroline-5-carboxylate reductase [Granulosicoccus antarcticus]ASJ71282.1 Pyrroline-5-carboxylate reductase [Granulosicoccus antarcticus IMCC3135]